MKGRRFVDGIERLDFKGDSLASQGLHEDLHASIQAYDDEDGGQGGGSTFVDGIRRLDFEGDSLAGQGLHEDLHASIQVSDDEDRRQGGGSTVC